jgi:autophagy-related protein 9
MPGPSQARPHWETAQAQQRLHSDDMFGPARRGNAAPGSFLTGGILGNARKRAEWRWANVSNLDKFIKEVYDYYLGCGIWCILLERALHLLCVSASVTGSRLVSADKRIATLRLSLFC